MSAKSPKVRFVLCLLFGYLGVHRFYVGKRGTGILWLFTLGLCGIGWIADLVSIGRTAFKSGAVAHSSSDVRYSKPAWRTDVKIGGSDSTTVYTYVPEVLKGVPNKKPFTVQIVEGDVELESTVTGTTWSTDGDYGLAVAYKGKVFGFTSGPWFEQYVKMLQGDGYSVTATARITKWDKSGGFPYVEMDSPTIEEIKTALSTEE